MGEDNRISVEEGVMFMLRYVAEEEDVSLEDATDCILRKGLSAIGRNWVIGR